MEYVAVCLDNDSTRLRSIFSGNGDLAPLQRTGIPTNHAVALASTGAKYTNCIGACVVVRYCGRQVVANWLPVFTGENKQNGSKLEQK